MGTSHHRILVEAWGSVGRAGGSLGLLLLSLLLLDGELGCQGVILQLHVRQRVLNVHQAGSLRSLELQCCRGLGLEAQLVAQLVSQLGIAVVAPLLQQVGCVVLHAASHELLLDEAVQDHPQHQRMIDTFTRWAPSMWGDRMSSLLISPARPKPCGGVKGNERKAVSS